MYLSSLLGQPKGSHTDLVHAHINPISVLVLSTQAFRLKVVKSMSSLLCIISLRTLAASQSSDSLKIHIRLKRY